MFGQQFVRNRAHGFEIHDQGIQVQQGHAVFRRGRDRNVAGLDDATEHQLGHKAGLLLGRRLQRRVHARLSDHAIVYQPLR